MIFSLGKHNSEYNVFDPKWETLEREEGILKTGSCKSTLMMGEHGKNELKVEPKLTI